MNQPETTTRITVLTVPGCPNAPLVRVRIATALAGRTVPVDRVEVPDEEEAVRRGMNGSPAVLVNGTDPFAEPGVRPSLSCRLYRHADGTTDGAPTVADLRRALAASGPAGTPGEG
ncbi:hypothetical protein SSP35_03_01210 [Streptomyces sp. NBRC 110611]|uniref:hypothetical protein n=1 Tax=Streptomyces sp. NBRC 110611 TaxID=1621259 RepID=UPI0008326889|nr:hypothetical protein [Streptomyces sp. NBRC 110611]GAU66473.1 hypothetical protein SSP35_03_01210 [Streptomyces sp. NBRC 110611]